MPRLKPADKRAQLLEQKAKLDAQLRAIDAKVRQTERKEDTRRKVIAGALALEHMTHNPNGPFATTLRELLARYVEPHARHLFPFLPSAELSSDASAPSEVREREGAVA